MLFHHMHMVIKEWRDVGRNLLCRTTLSWRIRHIIGIRGTSHQCEQGKLSDCLRSFIRIVYREFTVIFSFPKTWFQYFRQLRYTCTFLQKRVVGRLYRDTESDRAVTWHWRIILIELMYIVFVPFDWTRALSLVCYWFVRNSMNFCVFDPFITLWTFFV